MTCTCEHTKALHRFEKAGLGVGPFQFVGCYEDRGPKRMERDGFVYEVGSPGQPMGVCSYCGQGIALCCQIRDANGKTFIVGSDCVRHTGDSGLIKCVDAEMAKHRRELRHANEDKTVAWLDEQMAEQSTRDVLAAMPHPMGFKDRTTGAPMTALDWAEWMRLNSGASGKVKVARFVRKAMQGGTA